MRARDRWVWIAGGAFAMGSDRHYPEERPIRQVEVQGFWIDVSPVTNRNFSEFVSATSYRTTAEIAPDPHDYPHADPTLLTPGGLVFDPMSASRDLWSFVPGAFWRRPDGQTWLDAHHDEHPVVQVSATDAEAYAAWAGAALPTEVEWEFAARGGLEGTEFAWGSEFQPSGQRMANTWPGVFPRLGEPGPHCHGTSAVGAFPANGFGLFDMIGNVWEWTADAWTDAPAATCCGGALAEPGIARRVIKGGSHLCAPNHCRRYRPAARQPHAIDSGTVHVGFRCVRRGGVGATSHHD